MSQSSQRTTHAVFLSYAREDLAIARTVGSSLEDAGLSVAMDVTSIAPGDTWQDRLDQLLLGSAKIVFLASPASVRSEACAAEISTALELGKPILPVLLAGMGRGELPATIRHLHYTRLSPGNDPQSAIAALSQVIQTDIDWERRKSIYLLRADHEHTLLLDPNELAEAEAWAMKRPADAAPVPTVIRDMLVNSRARLLRRSRGITAVLASIVLILAALGGFAAVQWQRQVEATRQARVETALRSAAPAYELLNQGRQLDALVFLRDAVQKLQEAGPVDASMHDVLRTALRGVAGQRRYPIPNHLAAHALEGHLFVQDPATGSVQLVGQDGLEPTDANLPGEILHWDYVPDLATGVLVRKLDGRLLIHAFDPATLQSGRTFAELDLGRADIPHLKLQIGPDGLVLVNGYGGSREYFYEGTLLDDPVRAWVIDLSSGTRIDLPDPKVDLLMNDRQGRSYLVQYADAPDLQFDKTKGALISRSATNRELWISDAYSTCFRHYLSDPDLDLMISRMEESPEDSLSDTAFTLVRPECRFIGEWVITLTGRTSGSGFWKDVAIYDREKLLDRDGSWRDEGMFSREEGATRTGYHTLSTVGLPSLAKTDNYDPTFVAFDGRTLIGSFAGRELLNTTAISAAALFNDKLGVWVEAPTEDEVRDVILLDLAREDPFVTYDRTSRDPVYSDEEPSSEPNFSFPDGSRFAKADMEALGLVGRTVLPVPGKTQLIVSDYGQDIWLVSKADDGNWVRDIFFKSDRPAGVQAISNDGSLLLVDLGGATLGSTARIVVSMADGKIVEYLDEGPGGGYRPFGAGSFVQDEVSEAPDDLLTYYLFPDYAGYLQALNDAIRRLCSSPEYEECDEKDLDVY